MQNTNQQELLSKILELEEENRKLKQKTKYGLVWEDKPEKVVDDCNTKFPVLKVKEGKKFREIINDKNNPTNILIEGDNYHALSVLNYTHKNSIDVIYIDPPYNTGNNDFIYNDNYVDREDSYRHSKWLSFLNKRLKMARELLSDTGAIFISIDDNEQAQLKLLCDSVFGEKNFVCNVIVKSAPAGTQSSTDFALQHSYCYVYRKTDKFNIKTLELDHSSLQNKYSYGEDQKGKYYIERLWKRGIGGKKEDVPTLHFPVYYDTKTEKIYIDNEIKENKNLIKIIPYQTKGVLGRWTWSKSKMLNEREDLIVVKIAGEYKLHKKVYQESEKGRRPYSIIESDLGRTEIGSLELKDILGEKSFDYPKSSIFIKFLLKISTDKNSKILDFMAGSGTTGHAVLELNKEDGGNRQFILVTNNENKICEEVTFERISRVMSGYKNMKGEKVEGLGGNLKYLETEFIDRTKHTDNMKMRLMRACTEMLCLKENAFQLEKEVRDGDTLMYKIFSGVKVKDGITKKHLIGIYYDLDDSYLDNMRSNLKNQGEIDKSAYIFSLRNVDDFIDDYRKWKGINIEEIPQKILEIYEAILKNNSRNK